MSQQGTRNHKTKRPQSKDSHSQKTLGNRKAQKKTPNIEKRTSSQKASIPKKKRRRKKNTYQNTRNQQFVNKKRKLKKKMSPRQRKRRARLLIWRMFILAFAILLGLSFLFLIKVTTDLIKNPRPIYKQIEVGTLDTSTKMTGLVIRDETLVYSSNTGGVFQYKAEEGAKVQQGDAVCITTDYAQLYELQEQKSRLDEQIFSLQKANEEKSYFYDELYKINQRTSQAVKSLYVNKDTSMQDKLKVFRKSIESLTQQKIAIYTKESFENTKGLLLERSGIVKRMSPMQVIQKTEYSGTISYFSDNLEEELTIEEAEHISNSQYEKALKSEMKSLKEQDARFFTGADTPIYRVVLSDKASIIAFVDDQLAAEYNVGQTYEFSYGENKESEIELVLMNSTKEGKNTKLIFETSTDIEKLLSTRKIDLFQSKAAANGLIINTSAVVLENYLEVPIEYIRYSDEKGYVMMNGTDGQIEVPVNVSYIQENLAYVLIETGNVLQPYVTISHPQKNTTIALTSIKSQHGVYVKATNGIKICPVQVLLEDGKRTVVEPLLKGEAPNLDINSKILINPDYLKKINQGE